MPPEPTLPSPGHEARCCGRRRFVSLETIRALRPSSRHSYCRCSYCRTGASPCGPREPSCGSSRRRSARPGQLQSWLPHFRVVSCGLSSAEGTEGLDVCPLALRATVKLVVADASTPCCLAPMFRPPRDLTVMRLKPNRAGGVHPEERVLADVAAKYRRSFVTCLLGDDALGHTGRSSRSRKPGPRRVTGHVGGIEPDTSAAACCSGSILATRSRDHAVISCLAYRGRTRSRVRRLLAPSRQ